MIHCFPKIKTFLRTLGWANLLWLCIEGSLPPRLFTRIYKTQSSESSPQKTTTHIFACYFAYICIISYILCTESSKIPNSREVRQLIRQLCLILQSGQCQRQCGAMKRSMQKWTSSPGIFFFLFLPETLFYKLGLRSP